MKQYSHEIYNHGGIGYVDIEKNLYELGFEPIEFHSNSIFILKKYFTLLFFLLKFKKKSNVIFIHPIYGRMNKYLILFLIKFKKANVISIIGDIDGLRDKNEILLKSELNYLNHVENIIVHNAKMEEWFSDHLKNKKYIQLGFFDFITKVKNNFKHKLGYEIVFAGNFVKSKFINNLCNLKNNNSKLIFNLYGKNIFETLKCKNYLNFYGENTPIDTLKIINGSFGLIWDGDSIEKCEGVFGDYIKYNTQHKLSLYIISGLPIITWYESAISSTIIQNNIGFCVSSLFEIEEKIKAISETEYQQMIENLKPIAEKISKGYYLQTAIDNILKQ